MTRAARWRLGVSAVAAVALVSVLAVVTAGALTGGVQGLTVADEQARLLHVAPVALEAPAPSAGDTSLVDPDWVREQSARTGVAERALRAYADAALAVADEQPACRLGWTTLAGIAAIESDHGRHAGGVLDAQGRTTVPVIGPALDGSPGVAAIPADAAGTARHGDPRWDRAVGPFQFIGSTWERWQSDGDGDGTADPHDIDDAALTAARYLCAAGQDLSTGLGWERAVWSYNHSEEYVRSVLGAAQSMAP